MSSMKSGFSTLNRWLGKKNKDKNTPNGKLSKSNTNLSSLSVSSMNINETSQLEYNRITPLPAATSNAPFEQTFRITVLLPKEQLYVTRLGARVPLSKLLELVCDNKLLDAQKYEFRNPVDSSQIYSCDLTIGAVGLSEIRLCHKSESYDTFNADEVIKLHRTTIIRDSLSSSSEFSSRHSKLTTKTPSPYSSSNSLNSMDSTGMNYTRTPVTPPAALTNNNNQKQNLHQSTISLVAAPPRKKRVAPRPPSQSAIPEKSALEITRNERNNTNNNNVDNHQQQQQQQLTRRDLCVSTPNLSNGMVNMKLDCNGNSKISNGYSNGGMSDMVINANDDVAVALRHSEVQRNTRNSFAGSVQTLYANSTQDVPNTTTTLAPAINLPEPSPRKRMQNIKKKSAAPAPPSRGSGMADDTISIASTTVSMSAASEPPDSPIYASPMPRKREISRKSPAPPTPTSTRKSLDQSFNASTLVAVIPKPVPRSTTTTLLNAVEPTTPISETPPTPPPVATIPTITSTTTSSTATTVHESTVRSNTNNNNVSKVLLNRTPTPEPRSLTSPLSMNDIPTTPTSESSPSSHGTVEIEAVVELDDDDNASKQADSGIGEPVPSPLPDSLPPSESSAQEFKSTFESSSDDDDMVRVYNFKLGKTVIKPLTNGHQPSTLEELALLAGNETDSAEQTPVQIENERETPTLASSASTELTSWNFAIPISPPPNFADTVAETKSIGKETTSVSAVLLQDKPITPKIKARPVLNFEALASDETLETAKYAQSKEYTNTSTTNISAQEQSKASTPCTPMNDIVDELSTIIQEKRIDTLIKKSTDQSQTAIEAAKPNTLTNFSIGAATNTTAKPSCIVAIDLNTTHSTIVAPVTPPTPEPIEGTQEKLYRRNSATQQPIHLAATRCRSITRADSFQATTTTKVLGESTNTTATTLSGLLNRRSSSQISLTKMEQNEMLNRRRSSSELSIGESPTLQSPEVIKTILGSRKNSLANVSGDLENNTNNNNTNTSVVSSVSLMSTLSKLEQTAAPTDTTDGENEPKTNVEVYDTITIIRQGPQKMAEAKLPPLKPISKPEKIPKTYRYSGPPSINFSTWNERPKVQVQAIKNEGDYIFGGKHANRHSTVAVNGATDNNSLATEKEETTRTNEKLTIDTAAPILRMGIPRKEFKVPITVKPLRDISPGDNKSVTEEVVGTDLKKELERETEPKSLPVQLVTSHATTTINRNHQITNEVVSRQTLLKPTTTAVPVINASSTLPRVAHTNRYTMPAASHVLLRTTSISQLNSKESSPTANVVTPTEQTATVVPFGQGTLRRTGIKEKMLAREQQEQELAMRNANSLSYTNGNAKTATLSPPVSPKPATVNKTIFKSAKLELKLQQNTATTTTSPAKSPVNVILKPKQTNVTISTPSATPVPPPPPAPIPPKSLLKPVPMRTPTPTTPGSTGNADPRAQMLEAIRNFKREELNHN